MRVLIVEDDGVIAEQIGRSLTQWGLEPVPVGDFSRVMEAFLAADPQLVLMDVALPHCNGFYWCTQIRKISRVPVLFLSSRGEDMDIVMAMNLGGDDYVCKPVAMEVLMAKIRSLLRRAYDYELAPALTLGEAALDGGALLYRGERIPLTRNEQKILQTLLEHKGTVVSREQLMLRLWDSDAFLDDNTLTVNVNRLRKTLEPYGLGERIVTYKGEGYGIG